MSRVIVGTRGSALARSQTTLVHRALSEHDASLEIEERVITTRGDARQGTAAAAVSDKKEWISELEDALVSGDIDIAIHSGKDVPMDIAPGTCLISVLPRADVRDALVFKREVCPASIDEALAALSHGASVGTASGRRAAQIKRLRPDVAVCEHRGNVPTRIEKLEASETLQAIVLAAAGLDRLSLNGPNVVPIPIEMFLPAVSQGILAAQFREGDARVEVHLQALSHYETSLAWDAERACIDALGADCQSRVGVYASCTNAEDGATMLELRCRVFDATYQQMLEERGTAPSHAATELGGELAQRLLQRGAASMLS